MRRLRRICVFVYVCERKGERERKEERRAREGSVTDLAEAAVKGSSNTAGGEEIGAKKPEGYTLLEERMRGRQEGDRDPELKK